MKPTPRKPRGWAALRRLLAALDKPSLIALIKDLHDAASVNRDILCARVLGGADDGELLEKYRRKVVEQFFPYRGFGKLKLGEACQAIRDYRKATGCVEGTAELLMTYVENGAEFTRQFGDIDERFYNSIESALNELASLLRGPALGSYPQFAERLARVEQRTVSMGWGFHDYIGQVVGELEEECGGH